MPGVGTTKDENHPHPSLPLDGGGRGGGDFHINGKTVEIMNEPEPRMPYPGLTASCSSLPSTSTLSRPLSMT